jgi:hypothetical protein
VYLSVPYDYHCKQRLFFFTAFYELVFVMDTVFSRGRRILKYLDKFHNENGLEKNKVKTADLFSSYKKTLAQHKILM